MGRTRYTNPWVPKGHTHVSTPQTLLESQTRVESLNFFNLWLLQTSTSSICNFSNLRLLQSSTSAILNFFNLWLLEIFDFFNLRLLQTSISSIFDFFNLCFLQSSTWLMQWPKSSSSCIRSPDGSKSRVHGLEDFLPFSSIIIFSK
jgi:hypothetical protein